MKFYVIRHGQTNWNLERKVQGKTDIELNETGIKQSEEAKNILKDYPIDIIISSPLKRAKRTAEIINEAKNIPIKFEKALEERGFGDFEGEISTQIEDEIWKSTELDNYKINKNYKNVETIQELCNRVWNLLDNLKKEYPDKNILLVTHGGVTKAISGYFYGINEEDKCILQSLNLRNCEIKEFDITLT